jgi:malate dehydrogenase
MAYAGAEFCSKVLQAIKGKKVSTIGFVHLSADKTGGELLAKEVGEHLDYFSSRIDIGVCIGLLRSCMLALTL